MAVTAADVKELRESTGAGMMDCKKALEENGGDFDAAKDYLRQKGLASLDKRSARTAGEGLVEAFVAEDGRSAALVQVACETDFVAKGEQFGALATDVARAVFDAATHEISERSRSASRSSSRVPPSTSARRSRSTRRTSSRPSPVSSTCTCTAPAAGRRRVSSSRWTATSPPTSCASSPTRSPSTSSSRPSVLEADQVDPAELEDERRAAEAKAREEGKPEDIVPRIAEGAVKKYVKQAALLEQPYVKDDKKSVRQWLDSESGGKARVVGFARFEIGEESGA